MNDYFECRPKSYSYKLNIVMSFFIGPINRTYSDCILMYVS